MKNNHPNVSYTVKHNLCTGCGVCQDSCPTSSIRIITKNGVFIPEVETNTCLNDKGCARCFNTCPGVGIDIQRLSKTVFSEENIQYDSSIGRYFNCYTGYSLDNEIRYHSASGGMLSQFLIFLLENNFIDGAFVTAFDSSSEFLVNSYIAKTKEDILKAKSSKYSPVTLNGAINSIKKDSGSRFIVVGLPCHIHGFRKYETLDSRFKAKIIGYFGIYCSSGRSFHLSDYVFNELGIEKKGLSYLAYRDEGCLGSLVAKGTNSITKKSFVIKKRYQEYYHPLRSFFIPKRCTQCVDHFAELADVSFGDIHVEPYIEDKIGINSLVVRSVRFDDWLNLAKQGGFLTLEDLEIDKLKKSQPVVFHKKQRSTTFIKIDHLLGNKTPVYDNVEKDSHLFKSAISYLHTNIQIAIGLHRNLWFVIKYFKKNTSRMI